MFDLLLIASVIGTCVEMYNNHVEHSVPSENWKNHDLILNDRMNGVSEKEILKNAKNGKYKNVKEYPKPHRDSRGKIIIENCELYEEDYFKYSPLQVSKWVQQGKYNLTESELKIARGKRKRQLGF